MVAVVEVVVTHDLDLGGVSRLSALLDDALQLRPERIVVDLAGCENLGAAAIGLLVEVHRQTARQGAQLTLRSPSERLRRNLSLARVDRVLYVTPPLDPDDPLPPLQADADFAQIAGGHLGTETDDAAA
ncbi:STAS domain-containing protein [Hamadaea tsunoensis]|uniref:STAS domain-containing protein n=1 Tax=Hamadaea tsunoensis TaxID=53368 RepID=UPI00041EDAC3|nr:STAS domain-containing protein [Hamadaea tsunoensis]